MKAYICDGPSLKDTYRDTAPSQKTQALTKFVSIEIWVFAACE